MIKINNLTGGLEYIESDKKKEDYINKDYNPIASM